MLIGKDQTQLLRIAGFMIALATLARLSMVDANNLQSAEPKRPEEVTVTIGDITTRIDGPKQWTLSGIEYQQHLVAVQESAYGTVLNIRGVGLLGTAHFLDVPGKPNQIEKENVTRLQFVLDEQTINQLTPKMKLVGNSFRMERESTIRDVVLNSSVNVQEGVLLESVRIRTAQDVEMTLIYPMMYAWTPTATAFLFGDEDGVQKRGVFLNPPSKPTEGLERSSRWMAIYDGSNGFGAVCYVLQRPPNADAWMQFTDAPAIYRKLRLMSFSEKRLPAGFDGTFRTAIGFFNATETEWEKQAISKMKELKVLASQ